MFCKIDKDGDGFITAEDVTQSTLEYFEDLDEKEIVQWIRSIDRDGDGKISFTGTLAK